MDWAEDRSCAGLNAPGHDQYIRRSARARVAARARHAAWAVAYGAGPRPMPALRLDRPTSASRAQLSCDAGRRGRGAPARLNPTRETRQIGACPLDISPFRPSNGLKRATRLRADEAWLLPIGGVVTHPAGRAVTTAYSYSPSRRNATVASSARALARRSRTRIRRCAQDSLLARGGCLPSETSSLHRPPSRPALPAQPHNAGPSSAQGHTRLPDRSSADACNAPRVRYSHRTRRLRA